jgi:murein DD-endopeptidase MepM/ murein hydrolase activator NlpD
MSQDTYTGNPGDPLSLNLYTYCRNNPIRYTDPSGHADVPVRSSNASQGNTVSWKAGATAGKSTVVITTKSGATSTLKEGKDYYISGGTAYYTNNTANAVRSTNEKQGSTVKWSAGSSSGKSTITVSNSSSKSTVLKEGSDYYLGNDGKAYYYSNVRTVNEAKNKTVNYSAGATSGSSTIRIGSSGGVLKEGKDYYIGSDSMAHYMNGPAPFKSTNQISSTSSGSSSASISHAYSGSLSVENKANAWREVTRVQVWLNELGNYSGKTDGAFGELTREAVVQYQSSRGMSATGVVDENTWKRMQADYYAKAAYSDRSVSMGNPFADDKMFATVGRSAMGSRSMEIGSKNHMGIDIANKGEPVLSTIDGTIVGVMNDWTKDADGARGNFVLIRSSENGSIYTVSQHLASVNVAIDSNVTKGQQLGIEGRTGKVTGVHLHFEVLVDAKINGNKISGTAYNPWIFLP